MTRTRENYQKDLDKQWQSRINSLEEFIQKNNRLPSSVSKEELSDYQFLNTQKIKLFDDLLSPDRADIFKKLLTKYRICINIQPRKETNTRLDSIEAFIKKNNRLPSHKIKEELSDANFLWRLKNRLKNNLLPVKKAHIFKIFFNNHLHYFMQQWRRTAHTRLDLIEEFIEKNNRFPSSVAKEELSDYNFLWRLKCKFKQNLLTEKEANIFKAFLNKFQQHFK